MPSGQDIIYLSPDSTVSNTDWTVGSGTLHENLVTTAQGNPNGAAAKCTATDATFVVTMQDIDSDSLKGPLVSIYSIQVQFERFMEAKLQSNSLRFIIQDTSGTDYYNENVAIANQPGYFSHDLTERTTSDGGLGTAWTESGVNGLRLEVMGTLTGGDMFINWLRIKVIYNWADVTYPSDGTESTLILDNGLVTLKNGLTIVK